MLKVPNGQNPYNVIGQYIQNHIKIIEDIIATIDLDGYRTNELFMVDMKGDEYFVWKTDWYEGEQNVALIDFFPVSEAMPERENENENIYSQKDLDEEREAVLDLVLNILDRYYLWHLYENGTYVTVGEEIKAAVLALNDNPDIVNEQMDWHERG